MKKLIAMVLALVCVLGLVGCAKEINTITDFSKFAGMTKNGTDKIEATFDNNTGTPFYFTIEDKEDIDEIMDIIFSASFEKMREEVNGGSNTSIKILQDETTYSMGVMRNYEGQNGYTFTSTELQDKIIELARKAGAFEGIE